MLQQVLRHRRLLVDFHQLTVSVVHLRPGLFVLEVRLVLGPLAPLLLAVLLTLRRLQATLILQLDHGRDDAGVAWTIVLS